MAADVGTRFRCGHQVQKMRHFAPFFFFSYLYNDICSQAPVTGVRAVADVVARPSDSTQTDPKKKKGKKTKKKYGCYSLENETSRPKREEDLM